jgi:hypothetical protein
MVHSRTAWNDFFTGSPTVLQTNLYEQRQTPSAANVHVLNCLFRSVASSSSGGALYCSTSVTCLLVESSSFFTCKTSSGNGGAICFSDTGSGQCVFYKVCGFDCSAPSLGKFSRVHVYDVSSSKNYVNYSSIVHCINENSGYTLDHQNGKIHCLSFNSSMNKCSDRVGFYSNPCSDPNSVISLLSYSSFADNYATAGTFIRFDREGGSKCGIKSCNVLRNTQGTLGSEGIILVRRDLLIENSCILENKATYIFRQQYSSCTITLQNCTVDSTSSSGSFIIQNTVTKSFILALNHMSTQNCFSEYDSAGTLTPITQSSSSSKKQKLCYTDKGIFFRFPNGDFFSLFSILIFNFIHPYASSVSMQLFL